MKLNFKIQSEYLTLAKLIEEEINKKPKKIYMFFGNLKESGFDILEEYIIDTKSKLIMFLGIDKKNTTKVLLDNILKYTKDVYVYNNNDLKEFNSNIYIFEFENKANIYMSPSNASESGLVDHLSIFSMFSYNLKDEEEKKEYKENVKTLMELKKINFEKLNKSLIQQYIDEKIIFSNRQYEHNVKSISEFLGKKKKTKNTEINTKESTQSINIPKIDLSSSNFDIDIDISEAIEANNNETIIEEDFKKESLKEKEIKDSKENNKIKIEEVDETDVLENEEIFEGPIDLNDLLLTKSNIKLNTNITDKETNKRPEEKVISKKVDLNSISNYMFELPARAQSGKDADLIKIPNYIRRLIPNFFEFNEKAKLKIINGSEYKVKDIQVEIVDVKNKVKYKDKEAKMMQKKGQTYMTIMSKCMQDIEYEENDVVRIIKLSSSIYHIEIVSKELQEYKIWSKIMNKNFRGIDRKYGIM